jgi:Spy/CpxP family protein refolding chaperone
MKVWILIFSAAVFAGGTCLGVALQPRIAPPPPPPPKVVEPPFSANHRTPEFSPTRFASELKLTDEQDQKLDAILSDSQEEMQALGRAMRAAQERSRQRIVEILSPEQKAQFDALLAAERQKRSEVELDRNLAAWKKILSLSDDQSKNMRVALAEGRERRHKMYGKPGVDWKETRRDLRDKQNKDIEKVLTPAQFKQYLDVSELERFDR